MSKFKCGDVIVLSDNGYNTYEIIDCKNNMYQLQCIEYYIPEDLGDNIKLYGHMHVVWIACFFDYLFKHK